MPLDPVAFDSYQPDPETGGAWFTGPSAQKPVYLYGDEANNLKKWIDRTAPAETAQNDNRFAANETFQPLPRTEERSDATQAAPQPSANMVPAPGEQLPMLQVPQAAAEQPAAQNPIPSLSPEQAARMAGRGGAGRYIPTSQKVETEGGIQDPEMRAAAEQAWTEQLRTNQEAYTAQQAALAAQAEAARKQALDAGIQADIAQRERDKQEAVQAALGEEYKKNIAIADTEYEKQAKREVDPHRIFRGSPGNQIGAILLGALGGLGQGLARGGPNYALEAINRKIDQDIDAQAREIQQGVTRAGNNLSRIQRDYGVDLDTAKHMLQYSSAKFADAETKRTAALIGGQNAQLAAAQLSQGFAAKQAETLKAMHDMLYGKAKVTMDQRYQAPGAGDPFALAVKREKQRAEWAAAHSTAENEGRTPGKQAQKAAEGELTPQLSRGEAAVQTAMKDLAAFKERHSGFLNSVKQGISKLTPFNTMQDEDAAMMANAIALGENNANQPSEEFKAQIEHKLKTANPVALSNFIEAAYKALEARSAANKRISAHTARVGQVSGMGDSE